MATSLTRYELLAKGREERRKKWQEDNLNRYLQEQKKQQQAEEQESDSNWFERTLATVGDAGLSLLYGIADTTEGATDGLLTLVGALGGIFDDEFKQDVKDIVEYDATYNWLESNIPDLKDESYMDTNDSWWRDGFRTVGQLLPAAVAAYFSGGSAIPMIITGVSAGGGAAEEAYKEGAGFYEGAGYGLMSGAVEAGTEALFSGATSKIFGKGLASAGKTAGQTVAKTGAKRILKGIGEEAAEEAIASAVNPLLKTVYKGSDAFDEYATTDFYKDMAKSAVLGGAVGGVVGGVTGEYSKKTQVAESMQSIGELKNLQREYFANDQLTSNVQAEIKKATEKNLDNIERMLKNSTGNKRAELIKELKLENYFEENGTIRKGTLERIVGEEVPAEGENATERVFNDSNKRYASPELWGDGERVNADLAQITRDLRKTKENPDLPDIRIYEGELTDTERTNYKQAKKAVAALSKRTATGLNLVLTESSDAYSGVIPENSNTVYLTKDTLENGKWAGTLVHETMHFNEGTGEYYELVSILTSDKDAFAKAVTDLTSEDNPYGFNEEIFESMKEKLEQEKLEQEKSLTEDEQRFMNELGARMGEELLGNERFIERIVQKDASLAKRILAKIRDLIEALRTIGNKEARAEYKRLQLAEKLYMDAIKSAGVHQTMKNLKDEAKARNEAMREAQFKAKAEDYQKSIDKKLLEFIDSVNAMQDKSAVNKRKFSMGEISDAHAEMLEQILSDALGWDVDLNGYTVEIDGSTVKHIQKKHGENGSSDSSMKEKEDLARIGWAVNNADSGYIGTNKKGEIDYSTHYKNKDGSLAPKVVLETSIGNGVFVVTECVPDTPSKKIHIVSARKIKSGNGQVLNMESEDSLQPTSKTPLDGIATTNSITDPDENVNTKSQFSLSYPPKPKDPFTAGVVEGWGEDIDADEKRTSTKKPTAAETKVALELAEENTRRRDFNYTEGQRARNYAEENNPKVYTKDDASEIVSSVISETMNFGETLGALRGKSRQEIVEELWKRINKTEARNRSSVALDIAEYIIQSAVVEDAIENPANDYYRDVIDMLKPYVRKLDLSDLQAEIKHKYDDKTRRIYSRWHKRGGISPDVAAQELAGLGYQIDATNPADILFELEDAYQTAVQALETKAKTLLNDVLTAKEREALKQDISREILKGLDATGADSKLAKFKNEYTERINYMRSRIASANEVVKKTREQAKLDVQEANEKTEKAKERARETEARNKEMNRVIYQVEKLKNQKFGTYRKGSEYFDERFKKTIEKLGGLLQKRTLKQGETKTVMKELLEWYTAENPLLAPVEEKHDDAWEDPNAYSEEIRKKMESIANLEGVFTANDLRTLEQVLGYFNHFIESFNKIWRNGKYVEAYDFAEKYVKKLKKAKKTRFWQISRFFESGYMRTFGDPLSLMKYADKYDAEGFFTETFRELEKSVANAAITEMQLMEKYNRFFKDHKGYQKRLESGTIDYKNSKINVDAAIYLYMVTKSDHAWKGLAKSGFKVFVDGKAQEFASLIKSDEGEATDQMIEDRVDSMRSQLRSSFTKEDLAFIEIVEKILNEDCSKLKIATDEQRLGYSNVSGKYYVPLMRADVYRNIDQDSFFDGVNRVNRLSINKDRVTGAYGRLAIMRASDVLQRHIKQIAMYANLAVPIDNYNRLFNLNVGDNAGAPDSVASELKGGEKEFYTNMGGYLKEMIIDIQGRASRSDMRWYNGILGTLRSGYAKFQLAANQKVLMSQLSSFIAAGNILDYSSIVKGIAIKGKWEDVDKYCPLAQQRHTDNTVVKAQSVMDKSGKVGDLLMTPIGWVDRFVVTQLFGACQVQVEADGGAKVGTEENKKAAGKLLERVILETQQNSFTTGRSAAMRSGDEFLKSATMFSADAMKNFGRFMDSMGERLAIKYELKNNKNLSDAERKTLQARLKKARKQIAKSASSMIMSAAFMAMIGLLFRAARRQNEDKENSEIVWETVFDGIGNLLGGLPILRDVYSAFSDGYELENVTYATINGLIEAVNATIGLAGKIAGGENISKQEVANSIRKMLYSAGQVFGIPVRNIFNHVSTLTGWISDSAGYALDDLFYKQAYQKDLKKALENNDEKMISTITGLMIDEDVGSESESVRSAMKNLIVKAEKEKDKNIPSVLPKSLGNTITFEDEEYTLSASDKKKFQKIYSVSDKAVEKLVGLQSFQKADAEAQAKALRLIWDTYYNLARDEILGIETETKNVLFAQAIDIEKLAIIASVARSIKGDKDRLGNEISGSRKKKVTRYVESLQLRAVEKYMIMGYLGYTNTQGEAQVKAHIKGLDLSEKEKQKLLEYSGYKQKK